MPEAIVAGHICLDIIPSLPRQATGFHFQPGAVLEVGPAAISAGGAVSNTGIALHRLGVAVRLLGKVGDDPLSGVVHRLLGSVDSVLAEGLIVTPGHSTSYSVILNPPGRDRMFLHFPGANETFASDDIPDDYLVGVSMFHFGYPPAMRQMYEDGGVNLARLFRRVKAAGLTTALDMSYPDLTGPSGQADWRHILEVTLPAVDVFLPSLPEIMLMLEPEVSRGLLENDPGALDQAPIDHIAHLAGELIEMGAALVGIKAGARGLYLLTSCRTRLKDAGSAFPIDSLAWVRRELWSSSFETNIMGTTGAGDAAIAGFLLGLLRNMSPEETVTAACAAGASCVEAVDATSGVPSWEDLHERVQCGWKRCETSEVEGWAHSGYRGVWIGPSDTSNRPETLRV